MENDTIFHAQQNIHWAVLLNYYLLPPGTRIHGLHGVEGQGEAGIVDKAVSLGSSYIINLVLTTSNLPL